MKSEDPDSLRRANLVLCRARPQRNNCEKKLIGEISLKSIPSTNLNVLLPGQCNWNWDRHKFGRIYQRFCRLVAMPAASQSQSPVRVMPASCGTGILCSRNEGT